MGDRVRSGAKDIGMGGIQLIASPRSSVKVSGPVGSGRHLEGLG